MPPLTKRSNSGINPRECAEPVHTAVGPQNFSVIESLMREANELCAITTDVISQLSIRIDPVLTPIPPSGGCDDKPEPRECESNIASNLRDLIAKMRQNVGSLGSLTDRVEL